MAQQPSITACLIVKDEARDLPRCLASLLGLVDEVVVVDTGSTDATVAIAEAAGAKVARFTWVDDFSAARNAALAKATSAWVLAIDADEELVVADPARWRAALAARGVAYELRLVNVGPAGTAESEKADALRVYPRVPGVAYVGRIHEDVEPSLLAARLRVVPLDAAWIRHHGYQPAAMAAKAARNRRLAEIAAGDRPDDPLPWLYAAQATWLAGDGAGALDAVTRARAALARGGALAPRMRVGLALVEAWSRLGVGDAAGAEAALEAGLAEDPDHPELRYERGRRRVEHGDAAGAQADFEACLRAHTGRTGLGTIRAGVTGFLAHLELMGLAAARKDVAAIAGHAAAAAADPVCPPAEAARLDELAATLRRAAGLG